MLLFLTSKLSAPSTTVALVIRSPGFRSRRYSEPSTAYPKTPGELRNEKRVGQQHIGGDRPLSRAILTITSIQEIEPGRRQLRLLEQEEKLRGSGVDVKLLAGQSDGTKRIEGENGFVQSIPEEGGGGGGQGSNPFIKRKESSGPLTSCVNNTSLLVLQAYISITSNCYFPIQPYTASSTRDEYTLIALCSYPRSSKVALYIGALSPLLRISSGILRSFPVLGSTKPTADPSGSPV